MPKIDCPYNPGVNCPESGRHCAQCGWSPEVAQLRRPPRPKQAEQGPVDPPRRKWPRCRIVAKVNEAGRVLEVYPSIIRAAEVNFMVPTVVKNHLGGKLKNPFKCTGGYTFRYAD